MSLSLSLLLRTPVLVRLSYHTMSTKVNASGLSPADSKALQERQPTEAEGAIITSIHQLYSCKPTSVSRVASTLFAPDLRRGA